MESLITTSINMVDSYFLYTVTIVLGNSTEKSPSFNQELLYYFQELRRNYEDPLKRDFILWNNRDINIENKMVFWKAWRHKNALYAQNLLSNQRNSLLPQEFSNKYNIKVNCLK